MTILNKIKEFFASLNYRAKFIQSQQELIQLKLKHTTDLLELREKVGDPRYVVERVFGRKVKYFDPGDMNEASRKTYYTQAQMILNSIVFVNTSNKIIAEQCQEQARQYNPHQPTLVARDVQMTINAIELLREELESIPDPDKSPDKIPNSKDFDPHAGV